MPVLRFALALAAVLLASGSASASGRVDLELVLAVDTSRSIDEAEARMQREGTAAAWMDPAIIRAVERGVLGRVAVAYLDYSSSVHNRVIVDWRIIGNRAQAHNFARALSEAPLTFGRRTSISDAIEQGVRMIDENAFEGTRRVIDISGDGPNNWGRLVTDARDFALARRITINGLPIVNDRAGPGFGFGLADLDRYYQGCVIGGPGAFLVIAKSFKDFARAVRRKLIFEIADLAPRPRRTLIRHVTENPFGPQAFAYARGCDIGERLWERNFSPFFDLTP